MNKFNSTRNDWRKKQQKLDFLVRRKPEEPGLIERTELSLDKSSTHNLQDKKMMQGRQTIYGFNGSLRSSSAMKYMPKSYYKIGDLFAQESLQPQIQIVVILCCVA